MPARSITTARQERLGAELRKLRERAGLSAREASRGLGIDQTKISHMEAGRVGVSEERVRRLAAHYACDERPFVNALAVMATEHHVGWWEKYRGVLPASFLDLSELEHYATSLRTVNVTHVPGLFQTEAYASALFKYAVPELRGSEAAAWAGHRMQRRVVLEGGDAPPYDAVIHEAALRVRVGDRRLARAQLDQILELSDLDQVAVRVIPFAAEGFGGADCAMLLAGGPVQQLDTVQRDAPHGSGFIDAQSQLLRFRRLFRKVERSALDVAASVDFMRRLARET